MAAQPKVVVVMPAYNAGSTLRLTYEELVATPVPLPLVVPPRFHGGLLDAVHGLSAGAARVWKGGLAYQFVAICRRAAARA